jgi:hypothetical protein
VGSETSITIDHNGNPIISYFDIGNEDLKIAVCEGPTCASAVVSTIVQQGNTGRASSITIGVNGLPIISFDDRSTNDLRVIVPWWVVGGR